MREFSIRREGRVSTVAYVLGFCLFGLIIHGLPNLGIPLHSDVTWIYRLQTSHDKALERSIPYGMVQWGANPKNLFEACVDRYQFAGRLSCMDVAALRLIARFADGNGDLWRISYILTMATAVALFYMSMVRLNVPKPIAGLLALGLYFSPLDVWTDHKTAEPRGALFLMLSVYLILSYRTVWASILAAGAMLLAVLTKEPFLASWVVLPSIIYWRDNGVIQFSRRWERSGLIIKIAPHFAAFCIFLAFAFGMRATVPKNFDYASFILGPYPPARSFIETYLRSMSPILLAELWNVLQLAFFGSLLVAFVWIYKRSSLRNLVTRASKKHHLVLLAGLLAAIFLHGVIYYVTKRPIVGRYVLPANFLFAMFIGLALTPIYQTILLPFIRSSWKLLVVWSALLLIWPDHSTVRIVINTLVILVAAIATYILPRILNVESRSALRSSVLAALMVILALPHLDTALHNAAQNRVDQNSWQELVDRVADESPKGAHVVLEFQEPFMIETAMGLEANSLLQGRYDLTYHLEVEDTSAYTRYSGFLRALVDSFNFGRDRNRAIGSANALCIRADRDGGSTVGSILLTRANRLPGPIQVLRKSFIERYYVSKIGYLSYEISPLNDPACLHKGD